MFVVEALRREPNITVEELNVMQQIIYPINKKWVDVFGPKQICQEALRYLAQIEISNEQGTSPLIELTMEDQRDWGYRKTITAAQLNPNATITGVYYKGTYEEVFEHNKQATAATCFSFRID